VEAWHRSELTDVTAKVVSNMPIDLTALKLRLQIGEHIFQQRVWVRSNTQTFLASDLGQFQQVFDKPAHILYSILDSDRTEMMGPGGSRTLPEAVQPN
jgi:hypothetical protein